MLSATIGGSAGRLIFDRVASTLLFGLAANTDNLAIGVAYGMKRRTIQWQQNLFIAIVTTLITLVAMTLGRQIREMLSSRLSDILGGALLLLFATWSFYRERPGAHNQPSFPTSRCSPRTYIGMGESLFLAGTLSINNVGLAVAGGIGGVRCISAAWTVFCCSVVMLALGQVVGESFIRVKSVPRVLRYPMNGNAMLALAGVLMLAGY
jgi:putative Mn2+ efflux pump MntP